MVKRELMVIGMSDVIWIGLIAVGFFRNDISFIYIGMLAGLVSKAMYYMRFDDN